MKRTILICGLIGGCISLAWFLISEQFLSLTLSMNARMFCGYATMVLGMSVIFVAVKNYRDDHKGFITFGRAFTIGLMITGIASTVYVVVWLIDFTFFIPDFFDKYAACMLADLKAHGATAAELKRQMAEINGQIKQYKNPFFNVLYTYMEIVPVGLVISLIAALVLKKRKAETTTV